MEVKSTKVIRFPVTINSVKGVRAYIKTDIVKNYLSLLLSRKSMKTLGMVLDFKNDCCWISGKSVKLSTTTCGHPSLPLTNMLLEVGKSPNIVLNVKALDKCSKLKGRLRIYKGNLNNISKDKLISMVKSSRIFHKEFLDLIRDVCDSCWFCM